MYKSPDSPPIYTQENSEKGEMISEWDRKRRLYNERQWEWKAHYSRKAEFEF